MVVCSSCGRENPADSRFCNGCGATLADPPAARREERKIVTVLFADLVGFTSRAERLDPEDVRNVLTPYWERLRDELERFGGTVEKFIGDAVMALFGAPVAHEDDPERAVRAALAIRDWVRETGEDLQVRIAVNTGEALVLLGARPSEGEGMAAGDVVNTAARLQAAAPVNGILVGDSAYRATRHVIDYAAAPAVVAKGKTEPLVVWEAAAARSIATIETMSTAPLVGRHDELELLVGALQRARREREPQLVTVAGVPGIGKSRLVAELFAEVDADDEIIAWRRGRSLSYGEGVSLWALGEIVKAELGVLESDSRADTSEKLGAGLADLIGDETERAWLERRLAPLVGLPAEAEDRSDSVSAWRRWIEALAERRPLVLVFEDLQWADDDLLDFVDGLADWVSGVPLLVVCTTRPELYERRPGWGGGKRNAFAISLGPLDDTATARIVAATLDQALLPAETQAAVLARAGGNPLYAEQYARMVAEGAAAAGELPESVQGIVAARLDLLSGEEKALLQDAAVVGRAFWPTALGDHSDADARLLGLVRKEFIRRERHSSIAREQEYTFAHALVRDVAYAQIPRGARAERHRRAAAWIETLPPDRATDRAEMLAHHYSSALELGEAAGQDTTDLRAPARLAFREAGDRAVSLGNLAAAARFYSAALELWPERDHGRATALLARSNVSFLVGVDDPIRDAEEAIALFSAAGDREGAAEAELAAAKACWLTGRGDDATAHAERAMALVADVPLSRVKAEVLVDHARHLMLAGRAEEATRLSTEGLALAEQLGLEHLQASALITRGASRFGSSDGVLEDLQRGIAIAERAMSTTQLFRGLNNLAEYHWVAGEMAAVEDLYRQIRREAERLGLENQRRWVDGQTLVSDFIMGRWHESLAYADALIADEEHGRPNYMTANAYSIRASIRWLRETEGALRDSERAVAAARRAGDPQSLIPHLGTHATLLDLHGRAQEARQLAKEAIDVAAHSGGAAYAWAPPLLWGSIDAGLTEEYARLLAGELANPWIEAARATCDGDYVRAADLYAAIGARTVEAETRMRGAARLRAQGDRAESERQLVLAVAFYRTVGGTRPLREAEALLAATA